MIVLAALLFVLRRREPQEMRQADDLEHSCVLDSRQPVFDLLADARQHRQHEADVLDRLVGVGVVKLDVERLMGREVHCVMSAYTFHCDAVWWSKTSTW